MSKGNSPASVTPAPTPTPPTPTSSTYYQNGVEQASSLYDKNTNTYTNNSYTTPQQQNIQNTANNDLSNLVNGVSSAVNLSPDSIQKYENAYAEPQINAANLSYNQAKGQAQQQASSQGLSNSVGFGQYTANQLDKNQAQTLADIQANAYTQGLNLPNQMLAPYISEANLYSGLSSGQQAQMASTLQPAQQGVQAGNTANNTTFAQQLQAAQYQNQNSLYGYLQPQQFSGGY